MHRAFIDYAKCHIFSLSFCHFSVINVREDRVNLIVSIIKGVNIIVSRIVNIIGGINVIGGVNIIVSIRVVNITGGVNIIGGVNIKHNMGIIMGLIGGVNIIMSIIGGINVIVAEV